MKSGIKSWLIHAKFHIISAGVVVWGSQNGQFYTVSEYKCSVGAYLLDFAFTSQLTLCKLLFIYRPWMEGDWVVLSTQCIINLPRVAYSKSNEHWPSDVSARLINDNTTWSLGSDTIVLGNYALLTTTTALTYITVQARTSTNVQYKPEAWAEDEAAAMITLDSSYIRLEL